MPPLAARASIQVGSAAASVVGIVETGGDLRARTARSRPGHLDHVMVGADRTGDAGGQRGLVRSAAAGEAGGQRIDRLVGQPRHQRDQHRGVDAAGEEQAVGHVGAQMVGDGVDQHAVERSEQSLVVAGDRAAFGQRGAAAALDDVAVGELRARRARGAGCRRRWSPCRW